MQISITGLGLVTPAGVGIQPLWSKCLNKETFIQEGLGHITPNSLETLWSDVAESTWIKKTPEYLSKSFILALHSIIQAVEQANWKNFSNKDVIIIGTTTGQIGRWEKDLIELLKIESTKGHDTNKLRAQPLQTLADNLKNTLDFPGKILILASACSASTQAIVAAHDFLNSGRAERCIAGGVEELSDLTITGFGCLKLLSLNPCMPFDQTRVGINLSEGAGFYTFENNSTVPALAYLYGGDTVLDSFHMTSPSATGEGLQKSIISTLKKSQINANEVSMIHAHGTGSIHNDQSESYALNEIFPAKPTVISTKGVHGHALGASGSIELAICINILKEQTIPPVTGLTKIDEQLKINAPVEVEKRPVKYILKTTLGFGGVNSSFILGSAHA